MKYLVKALLALCIAKSLFAQSIPASLTNVWISGGLGVADHQRGVTVREAWYNPGPLVLIYRTSRSDDLLHGLRWHDRPPRSENAFLVGGAFRVDDALLTAAVGNSWRAISKGPTEFGNIYTVHSTIHTYNVSAMKMSRYAALGISVFGDLGQVQDEQHAVALTIQVGNFRR